MPATPYRDASQKEAHELLQAIRTVVSKVCEERQAGISKCIDEVAENQGEFTTCLVRFEVVMSPRQTSEEQ